MSHAPFDNDAFLKSLLQLRAEDRSAHFEAHNGDPSMLDALADEAERWSFVDVHQALLATDAIIQLADTLGYRRARARRGRAQALAYAGRHDQALDVCSQAIRLAVAENDAIEAARARLIGLHPLNELGRFAEAVEMGESARRDLMKLGEVKLAARADFNLGGIHLNRDDPRQALFHFDRAAPAFQDDPLISGYLNNNRGEALLLLNDFDGARAAFELALAATRNADAGVAAAIVEGNLADLAARRGRLPEALEHFERARRRFEANRADGHLARLLSEQAEAIATLGSAQDALREFELVLPRLTELGLASEVARAQLACGRLLIRLNRNAEAARALAIAADVYDELSQPRQRAHVDLIRADLLLKNHETAAAADLHDDAAACLQERHMDRAFVAFQRARIERQTGDTARADQLLSDALIIAEQLDIAPLRAEVHTERGDLRRTFGRIGDAAGDFRSAIQQIERVRQSLQSEQHRMWFFSSRLQPYEGLIQTLADNAGGRSHGEIFETIERSKSRGLLDGLHRAFDPRPDGDDQDSIQGQFHNRAVRLIEELNALYSPLTDSSAVDRIADQSWRNAVSEREQELRRIQHRLGATAQSADWLAPPVSLDEYQRNLAPESALLQFFQLDERLIEMLVLPNRTELRQIKLPRALIQQAVEQVRFQISRAARPGAVSGSRGTRMLRELQIELKGLYENLFEPISDVLPSITRLVVAPHGALHLLPFHALWDGRQYLIEKVAISYVPSASVGHSLQERAALRRDTGRTAVVGISDPNAPQIDVESRDLALQLSADLIAGPKATRAAIREILRRYQFVHLACHARFSSTHPEASGLMLADGWLTLREISPIPMNIELVTLSGCSTGQNNIQAGDELIGLLRCFLSAGARSVVASLWPAHDECTRDVMKVLYDDVRLSTDLPGSRAAALRSAQQAAMSKYPHPFMWAPFVLVGAS